MIADHLDSDPDAKAAYYFRCELISRIDTQPKHKEYGREALTLANLVALFDIARRTVKRNPGCKKFEKNIGELITEVLRPFVKKWHRKLDTCNSQQDTNCKKEFWAEYQLLQKKLKSNLETLRLMYHSDYCN